MNTSGLERLQKQLRSRSKENRREALEKVRAKVSSRPEAVSPLVEQLLLMLDDKSLDNRYLTRKILETYHHHHSILPYIHELLPQVKPTIQSEMLQLLGNIDDVPEGLDLTTFVLQETKRSPDLLLELVVLLGQKGNQLALPILARHVHNTDPKVAVQADTSYSVVAERFGINPAPEPEFWLACEEGSIDLEKVKNELTCYPNLDVQAFRAYFHVDGLNSASTAVRNALAIVTAINPESLRPDLPSLLSHPNTAITHQAISLVRSLSDPDLVALLFPLFEHMNDEVMAKAGEVVLDLISPKQLLGLLPLPTDQQTLVALNLVNPEGLPDLSHELIRLTDSQSTGVLVRIVEMLGHWANPDVNPTLHALWDRGPEVRAALLDVLPVFKDLRSVPLIAQGMFLRGLEDKARRSWSLFGELINATELFSGFETLVVGSDETDKWDAVADLQKLASDPSFETVLRQIYPLPIAPLQGQLAKLAGEITEPEALQRLCQDILRQYLRSNQTEVLLPTLGAIIKQDLTDVLPTLVTLCGLGKGELERPLWTTMARLVRTENQVQYLVTTLEGSNRYTERVVFQALVMVASPSARTTYLQFLEHRNAALRVGAVGALGSFEDPQLIPELVRMLGDKAGEVRQEVVRVLHYADTSVVLPIVNRLDDSDNRVREVVYPTLQKIFAFANLPSSLVELTHLHPNKYTENAFDILVGFTVEDRRKAATLLHQLLYVDNPTYRANLVGLIHRWGLAESGQPIQDLFFHQVHHEKPEDVVLPTILDCLQLYHSPNVWEALQLLLDIRNHTINDSLVDLLVQMAPTIPVQLADALVHHPKRQGLLTILAALQQTSSVSSDLIPAMVGCLRHKKYEVMRAAAEALRRADVLPMVPRNLELLRRDQNGRGVKFGHKKGPLVVAEVLTDVLTHLSLDFNESTEAEIWVTLLFESQREVQEYLVKAAVGYSERFQQLVWEMGLTARKSEVRELTLTLLYNHPVPLLSEEVQNLLSDRKESIRRLAQLVLAKLGENQPTT